MSPSINPPWQSRLKEPSGFAVFQPDITDNPISLLERNTLSIFEPHAWMLSDSVEQGFHAAGEHLSANPSFREAGADGSVDREDESSRGEFGGGDTVLLELDLTHGRRLSFYVNGQHRLTYHGLPESTSGFWYPLVVLDDSRDSVRLSIPF
ncbi:hypothetical protein CYMTET_49065 [Cymbomonas tetramitiformis]|uniref:SPRY domain-containing protein n=1 Tax=Cymbomonas tetramitiformis TaxID=36881 RepID=A0AAE0BSX1_9CHLO|nr:hypothetical protein CYMTET_49065 [Cymbomonas tetramitiformis]